MSDSERQANSQDQADQFSTLKSVAAHTAAAAIPDGAVLGLGSGTTVEALLYELAARVAQGLKITCVAASRHTASIANSLGIPLADFDDEPTLTMSIDGADEVTLPHLHLIKGGGGALLREKLIAAASSYRIIIVDSRKLVNALGSTHPVPVEVTAFGWRHTRARLAELGCRASLRGASTPLEPSGADTAGEAPYITDGGNYILDCDFGTIAEPEPLSVAIKTTIGVVEHGLFLSMTDRLIVAAEDGVQVYDRSAGRA